MTTARPSRYRARAGAIGNTVIDARADIHLIGLMRAGFGLIVIMHFWPDAYLEVTPVERFHEPWWSWLPVPSATGYRVLIGLGILAGALMIIGLASRLATAAAASVVLYQLVLDLNSFGHNRAFLTWMLVGLALLPTDRWYSLDAWFASRSGKPPSLVASTWPVVLMRVVASSVYLSSAGSKLFNPDWAGGLVLWDRTVRYQNSIPSAFDGWIHDLLLSRWFHRLLSPGAIVTELAIGVGLWIPRFRRLAIALAVVFHISIELTSRVQTFSYSAIAALTIWLVPSGVGRLDRCAVGYRGRSAAPTRASRRCDP